MNDDLYAALLHERYGRPPFAEYRRPLLDGIGDGRPDTRRAIRSRRQALRIALDETRHIAPDADQVRAADGRYVA